MCRKTEMAVFNTKYILLKRKCKATKLASWKTVPCLGYSLSVCLYDATLKHLRHAVKQPQLNANQYLSTRNGPRTTGSVSLLCAMTSTHRIICQALTWHNRRTICGISRMLVCHFAGSNLSRQRNPEHLRTNYKFVTQQDNLYKSSSFFRDLSNKLLSIVTAHSRFFLLNHFLAARVVN